MIPLGFSFHFHFQVSFIITLSFVSFHSNGWLLLIGSWRIIIIYLPPQPFRTLSHLSFLITDNNNNNININSHHLLCFSTYFPLPYISFHLRFSASTPPHTYVLSNPLLLILLFTSISTYVFYLLKPLEGGLEFLFLPCI